MRTFIFYIPIIFSSFLSAQVYIVNNTDDIDDGVCDGFHCSLREAIIAAEEDGVPSTIKFNIPGNRPFIINPKGPFPTINHPNLTVLGETQPGGSGSIQIDFNFRDFNGKSFWNILGSDFYISGIDFTKFLFHRESDCIFQFGEFLTKSEYSQIKNCIFFNDQFLVPEPLTKKFINIVRADNLRISNCIFGSNRSLSSSFNTSGNIFIDRNQSIYEVYIDSNIFVNRGIAIDGLAGNLHISKNIFGATDTSKLTNFLNPELAIRGSYFAGIEIKNNFFFGYPNGTIFIENTFLRSMILNNRFFDNIGSSVILLDQNYSGEVIITNNYATIHGSNSFNEPNTFIHALKYGVMYVENNEVHNYGSFLIGETPFSGSQVIHSKNVLMCIWKNAVLLQGYPIPTINSVNSTQITGSGIPKDSVVIYYNDRMGCPGTICEGGVELGRAKIDTFGNWNLNIPSINNVSISAYQFSNNLNLRPRIYSDFSDCFQLIIKNEDNYEGASEFKFSPNPVMEKLKIESNLSLQFSIQICNFNGQKIRQISSDSKNFELDMSHYNPGIYIFKTIDNYGQQIHKIFKN